MHARRRYTWHATTTVIRLVLSMSRITHSGMQTLPVRSACVLVLNMLVKSKRRCLITKTCIAQILLGCMERPENYAELWIVKRLCVCNVRKSNVHL